MNNSIFESIFAVFDDKPPFLSILDTFWPIFGHFSYSTSINHSLTIELNNILNWITRVYFELNNILNWILGKAILNRILNESFFGKIQILNWIRLGIVNHKITRISFNVYKQTEKCVSLGLNERIIDLVKKRSQLKQAVAKMVTESCTFLDKTPDKVNIIGKRCRTRLIYVFRPPWWSWSIHCERWQRERSMWRTRELDWHTGEYCIDGFLWKVLRRD